MNQNTTPTLDGTKCLKSSLYDTNSISGSIVIPNNCNNSQLSSPDMSEANEMRNSSMESTAHVANDERDDKHRSGSLLKIPSAIKMEQQQSVS